MLIAGLVSLVLSRDAESCVKQLLISEISIDCEGASAPSSFSVEDESGRLLLDAPRYEARQQNERRIWFSRSATNVCFHFAPTAGMGTEHSLVPMSRRRIAALGILQLHCGRSPPRIPGRNPPVGTLLPLRTSDWAFLYRGHLRNRGHQLFLPTFVISTRKLELDFAQQVKYEGGFKSEVQQRYDESVAAS